MMNKESQSAQFLSGIEEPGARHAVNIHITGLVQGVGFRPHVYRAAGRNCIDGWVKNTTNGVLIKAVGPKKHLNEFISDIANSAPPVAEILNIKVTSDSVNGEQGFHILKSTELSEEITDISPDIAVCPDCLHDMGDQAHRKNYLLINCTNCGPRFSIIKNIPYDRQYTTMAGFTMCNTCAVEYHDVANRRFHAQPVACNHCGPQYSLYDDTGQQIPCENLPEKAAQLIDGGSILAIKGNGGFHLACDAMNQGAINRLRTSKLRQGKPFAVMFSSIESVREFAHPDISEIRLLQSWIRPIVLLRGKQKLPKNVNAGLHTVGAMLPYMPLHHEMFKFLKAKAIVMTSGNISEAPVIIDREEAMEKLATVFDFLIDYDREIFNRTDDSVARLSSGDIQIIRRSRGYVPRPVRLSLNAEGIFATGGELKNTFCLGKGNSAILSQHIGDLKNVETFSFFTESTDRAKRLFRFEPSMIATDLHPDFLTSGWSREQGLPVEYVQHHHAHIASCMAEHLIEDTVIGLSFDGTGFGTDGHIWGSEILLCNFNQFERLGHFEYLPVPGGDKAVKEPWRMAIGCLYKVYGDHIPEFVWQGFKGVDRKRIDMVLTALQKNINISLSSGIGRLFDAVASLLGLCHFAEFEAEGPMRLEACIGRNTSDFYPAGIEKGGIISIAPVIEGVLHDKKSGIGVNTISSRFHNSLIEASAKAIALLLPSGVTKTVALSGGAFQNLYLLSNLTKKLQSMGLKVLTNHEVPVNDGGVALGQLVVAAARRNKSCV